MLGSISETSCECHVTSVLNKRLVRGEKEREEKKKKRWRWGVRPSQEAAIHSMEDLTGCRYRGGGVT
jgi:hypothetical protein